MSYSISTSNLKQAVKKLNDFKSKALAKEHARFLFPYLCGTYFTYRKVDILRISAISNAINNHGEKKYVKYLEVGCANGDFLERIREFIPNAKGIERNSDIFYALGRAKPEYIEIKDVKYGIDGFYDIIFVGWMDPGEDFRDKISESTDLIITTLDQGLSLAAEYEGHGFWKLAQWISPSWEDVNIEIANRYYSSLDTSTIKFLSRMRGAHNLWYIYCKDEKKSKLITQELKKHLEREKSYNNIIPYEFEPVLDDCGFRFYESLEDFETGFKKVLWKVEFSKKCE